MLEPSPVLRLMVISFSGPTVKRESRRMVNHYPKKLDNGAGNDQP